MNFELFIAKRIISSKPNKNNKTKPLVGTAIIAIALGLTVMILSVAILTGFKKEITDKLVGFSSHIQIVNLDNNTSFETAPIQADSKLEKQFAEIPEIIHVQRFATKAAIIYAKPDLQGIVLKGIDDSYNYNFLSRFLISGEIKPFNDSIISNEVIISKSLASLLKLKIGDRMRTFFIPETRAARPFVVGAIYSTGLEEFDRLIVFCDIRHIQKVSGWNTTQITGYELILADDKYLETTAEKLFEITVNKLAEGGDGLDVQTVREISAGFFDFLKLTDTNVWVILVLMILVSGFNMVSGLLILIINRTSMIGILKALGASTRSLQKVFLIQAAYIISIGLVLGNLFGLSICFAQDWFKIIPLDPASYFVDTVPINLNPIHILLLNLGALMITLIMLIIPSGIISKISPAKTIKFD